MVTSETDTQTVDKIVSITTYVCFSQAQENVNKMTQGAENKPDFIFVYESCPV